MKRSLIRLAIVCGLATATALSHAYITIPASLEDLSRSADYVLVGQVVEQHARYNDRQTMILTHTTIEVEEGIVGNPPVTLEISDYGGRVGNIVLAFSGQVSYRDGERVLVFLCRDAANRLRTCGAHQGRLDVTRAADGTREVRGIMAGKQIRGSVAELRSRILAARGASR